MVCEIISHDYQSFGRRDALLEIHENDTDFRYPISLAGNGIDPGEPVANAETSPRTRQYDNVPQIASINYIPIVRPTTWMRYAAIAALFFFGALLYGFYLWRKLRVPEEEAAIWNEAGPRHFSIGSIGGKPASFLDDETLGQLADSMGYFQSQEQGRVLNVHTSIQATLRHGGIPTPVYFHQHQMRSLLILEDAFAQASKWNPMAREMAVGMQRRGVPVIYGRFHGSPSQFKTDDGASHRLDDLEDQRSGFLLLIFTDGKGLSRYEAAFALETVARWPMVAWMELREPRLWDEGAQLPVRHGIAIYPATPNGALLALRRFLTEQGGSTDFSRVAQRNLSAPAQLDTNLDATLEQLLGDALMWAQDCAMLQPISPGLADGLRQKFHSYLPAERIQRIYTLPGTLESVAGIRFARSVERTLRQGFLVRRDEASQETVLRFLLNEIQTAEPAQDNSLAYLAWEAVQERIRLELEPDVTLVRLAQLAETPLGNTISASLDGFGFRDQPDKIPLRLKPRDPNTLQRLARISESFNISRLERYPVSRLRWTMLIILLGGFLGYAGWGVRSYINSFQPPGNIRFSHDKDMHVFIAPIVDNGSVAGEALDITNGAYVLTPPVKFFSPIVGSGWEYLLAEGNYRTNVYAGGHRLTDSILVNNNSLIDIRYNKAKDELPCREEVDEIGLIIERCPATGGNLNEPLELDSWRMRVGSHAPAERLISIGIEISSTDTEYGTLRRWRNLLLSSSSVDVIYRIRRVPGRDTDTSDAMMYDLALSYIATDLSPWLKQSQIIWWGIGDDIDLKKLYAAGNQMLEAKYMKVSRGKNTNWVDILEPLFRVGQEQPITEEMIVETLESLGPVEANTDTQIVLMGLPLKSTEVASLLIGTPTPNNIETPTATAIPTKISLSTPTLTPTTVLTKPIEAVVAFALDEFVTAGDFNSGIRSTGRSGLPRFVEFRQSALNFFEYAEQQGLLDKLWLAAYRTGEPAANSTIIESFPPIVDWVTGGRINTFFNEVSVYEPDPNKNTPKTPLYDLVRATLDALERVDAPAHFARHAIIYSDGFEEINTLGLDELIRRAQINGIQIHTVMLGVSLSGLERVLQKISLPTGGQYISFTGMEDMQLLWRHILSREPLPTPNATATLPAFVTRRPTSTPSPIITGRPTSTPTRSIDPNTTPVASVVAIEVLQENESHVCHTGSPDTWHFDVRLGWRYKDGSRPLPSGSTFEVVIWIDNGDPLNPGQALTMHGPNEIVPFENGKFSLERRPKALVPVFTSLKGGTLTADTLYKWGIVQVAQGRRVALLTPAEGCKFVLHADILKK